MPREISLIFYELSVVYRRPANSPHDEIPSNLLFIPPSVGQRITFSRDMPTFSSMPDVGKRQVSEPRKTKCKVLVFI
jgi:hypothetical protein